MGTAHVTARAPGRPVQLSCPRCKAVWGGPPSVGQAPPGVWQGAEGQAPEAGALKPD